MSIFVVNILFFSSGICLSSLVTPIVSGDLCNFESAVLANHSLTALAAML